MSLNHVRRALVLTDEKARHPFRRSLPPHVCAALITQPNPRSMRQAIVQEWKSFIATYCAGFVAVIVFVA